MATQSAARPRPLVPDLERFGAYKSRIGDFYNYNAEAVRLNKAIPVWAGVFPEMRWLADEFTRLGGPAGLAAADEARFRKTVRFVLRVCEEQAEAIQSGQFVTVAAGIFGAYRFLVRQLQATIIGLVDEDTALSLMKNEMPEEHADRIQLDLSEGIVDDEPPKAA